MAWRSGVSPLSARLAFVCIYEVLQSLTNATPAPQPILGGVGQQEMPKAFTSADSASLFSIHPLKALSATGKEVFSVELVLHPWWRGR